MTASLTEDVLQDEIAVSLARVMAAANRKARECGIDLPSSIISVTQRSLDGGLIWRVNYGPKDYVGRRGGDLIVDVDAADATIRQVLRGQ
jgi:hypothetical protein